MKRNIKITFKTIFIIILFVFVVIPLLLKILEYKEGFRTEVSSTHSDYNIDLKKRYNNVDRIKDSDNNSTYKYCIGGIIKCKGSESNATLDEISLSNFAGGISVVKPFNFSGNFKLSVLDKSKIFLISVAHSGQLPLGRSCTQ